MQALQVSLLADQTADDVEHFQPYGFTSSPPAGSEAVVVSIGGNTDHLIAVVVTDRSSRLAGLLTKDSAIYTDDGNKVHCKSADGSIAAVPSSSGLVHLGADAGAEFVALADKVLTELQSIKSDFDAHTHAAGTLQDSVPAPCTGATATPTAMTAPSSVAATKVKAT
jgi:phage baseplate assembly protein V